MTIRPPWKRVPGWTFSAPGGADKGACIPDRFVSAFAEAERIDVAVYAAIARTSTPALDSAMARLSRAADYSRLSMASAAALALAGGSSGRRAAVMGLASVGVTSAI